MKKLLVIVYSLLFSFHFYGQQEIEKIYDYTNKEDIYDIITCDDGGYLIMGLTKIYNYQTVVIKVDNQGNLQWDKIFEDYHFTSAQSCPGGFYLGGREFQSGGYDMAKLAKINNHGDILWIKEYEFDYGSYLSDVLRLENGDLLLLKEPHWWWYSGAHLIKTDSVGNIIWKKGTYGKSEIVLLNDNEIALSGYLFQDLPEPQFDDTLWPLIDKFNLDGVKIFSFDFTYMDWSLSRDLFFDGNDYYMITDNDYGEFNLVKFDGEDTVWINLIDSPHSIQYMCFPEYDRIMTTGSYGSSLSILTLSSQGDSIGIYLKNDHLDQDGSKILIDNDSVVIAGSLYQNDNTNRDMFFLKMPLNYLITRMKPSPSTFPTELLIYPNPFTTSTIIEFQLDHPSEITITIFNHLGKQVDLIRQQQQSGEQQITWKPQELPPGIFYFTLQAGDKIITGKMVLLN